MSEHEVDGGGLPAFTLNPVGVLRRRWKWMLVVLILSLAAAITAVMLLVYPRYLATTRILISSPRISEDLVRRTIEDEPVEKLSALIGELLSRDRLLSLLEKHQLYPELTDSLPLNEILLIMRRDVAINLDLDTNPIRRHSESAQIFKISFMNDDPVVAASVANDLANEFMAANIRMRTRQTRLTTEFLRRELEATERELAEQNSQITVLRQKYRGELPEEQQANLGRLERLQSQRQSLALQIAEAETRIVALAQQEERNQDETSPRARLNRLRARLAEQQAVYTDEHPNVTALRRQVEALEAELERGEATGKRSALLAASQRTVNALRRQLVETEGSIRQLEARVERTPEHQEELARVQSKADVLSEKYRDFERKVQEAELAEKVEAAQQGQQVAILDPAIPPLHPDRSRLKYLIVGVLGSFGAAIGLGVLAELIDPVIVSRTQVESDFGLEILGSVPPIS